MASAIDTAKEKAREAAQSQKDAAAAKLEEMSGSLSGRVAEGLEQLSARLRAKDVDALMREVLERFPRLRERLANKGQQLSGGEQQMLAIARALLTGPELLLLDEPSQGLAPIVVNAVMDTIRSLKAERVSMLLVEQNAEMALQLADRVYVIDHGTVVFEGTPERLRADRRVTGMYLGVGV